MPRPPNHEFQEWWNKLKDRSLADDDPSASSSTPSSSSHSVSVPSDPFPATAASLSSSSSDKRRSRSRSSRQTLHLVLLKLQSVTSSSLSLAHSLFAFLRTAFHRILLLQSSSSPGRSRSSTSRLYRAIKFFLILVVTLLAFEIVAYYKGWHFSPPKIGSQEVLGFVEWLYAAWVELRARYLAPQLQRLTNLCIVLFLAQSVDRVVLVLGCLWIKLKGIKPKLAAEDEPGGEEGVPMVLVQIPMCNEREVSKM